MDNSRIVPVFQALAEDIHALGVRTVFGLVNDFMGEVAEFEARHQ